MRAVRPEPLGAIDTSLENSFVATIAGIERSVRARVPRKELLSAFKLHAARKADIRDVIMLGEEADWKRVFDHSNRGSLEKLMASLEMFSTSLDDIKLVNSLKGEFSLQGDVSPSIHHSKQEVQRLMKELKEQAH